MSRTLIFTDTHPYSLPTSTRPVRRPEVPVRVFNVVDPGQYIDLNMLVDSGADTTCLPLDIMGVLGIDMASLSERKTRGVSGTVSAYRHEDLLIALTNKAVRCPVLFVPNLPAFLLGREGVFDEFVFAFEQSAGSIHVGAAVSGPI